MKREEKYQRLRELAPESMLFLKRDGSFPLPEAGSVALYGNGVRYTLKGGTGSGDVNLKYCKTCEDAFRSAGFRITSEWWINAYDEKRHHAETEFIESIKKKAREEHVLAVMLGMGAVMPEPDYNLPMEGSGDTAVYILSRICGEGNDRQNIAGDFALTDTEIRDILWCDKKYDNFLLVLNVGGIVDLTPVSSVSNILIMSQLGEAGADALCDVILGKSYPSGKLTDTWAAYDKYPAFGSFGERDNTEYREGIYVGYRYFDSSDTEPLFPFGYGLGYTDFKIEALNKKPELSEGKVDITVRVTNTGKSAGKETVQLYVTAPWGKLDRPYQELIGFKKTKELAPGESEDITVSADLSQLASYDEARASYIIEKGEYILRAGNSSRDTYSMGILKVSEDIITEKLCNRGGRPGFTDWKPEHTWGDEDISGIPEAKLSESDIIISSAESSQFIPAARRKAESLSDDELVKLCIGYHKRGSLVESVVGEASTRVAGAAGESASLPGEVPAMVMADGPAGLRLSLKYTKDEKGAHPIGATMPASMEPYMPTLIFGLIKPKDKNIKGRIYEHICIAIPVGTAIAQTWNPEAAEEFGDIVGSEMQEYGVNLWLAPGMNIHRNPLCGRNFEYYSEDPLISGTMAAAITTGVQKHDGCGTTIKHFCANNQETNRYQSNSLVSERALREIYLRGFENCIKKSDPVALMTSYNLINGIHTNESGDLLKGILRKEWEYSGLIMTDWLVAFMSDRNAQHRTASVPYTFKAGNNLFMPGSSQNVVSLRRSLKGRNKNIRVTRDDLVHCATYIIAASMRIFGK